VNGHQPPVAGDPRDLDAAAAAAAIAGLRWSLRDQRLLPDPAVQAELHKLELQLASWRSAGRLGQRWPEARRAGALADGTQVDDAEGYDLKPDPLEASTAAELMAALRAYRDWAGRPSWRTMAGRAGQAFVHSTLWAAMNRDELPGADVLAAILAGCGASEEDRRAFMSAWRSISAGRGRAGDSGGDAGYSMKRGRDGRRGSADKYRRLSGRSRSAARQRRPLRGSSAAPSRETK
jgi:hypothetical protein